MKLTARLRLLPNDAQADRLLEMVERCNLAADWAAGVAFSCGVASKFGLQRMVYRQVRENYGLPAQPAILCAHRAAAAYGVDRTRRPTFPGLGPIPYDPKSMSFQGIDRVKLVTLGRRVVVPYLIDWYGPDRADRPKGRSYLEIHGDGAWRLDVAADVPDGTVP